MNFDKDHNEKIFKEKCSELGMKVTPQRVIIYKELMKSKDHPSADMIYKRVRAILHNISFDTVYRTLLSFSEKGIIRTVEGYSEKKRFEPDLRIHHHFRCIKCAEIIDFDCHSYDDIAVPEELKKYFKVFNSRVILEGLCIKCGRNK